MSATATFTCLTCRVAFIDAELQRSHYKTDWHRYNLKRKVADLPPVTAENFQERVLAQREQLAADEKSKSAQCKVCNKSFSTENQYLNHISSRKHREIEARQAASVGSRSRQSSEAEVEERIKEKNAKNAALAEETKAGATTKPAGPSAEGGTAEGAAAMEVEEDDGSDAQSWESWDGVGLTLEQCLFCAHQSRTLDKKLKHMSVVHSFFLPDLQYVSDLEGLITYLGEKVGEGHICLWCNEKSRMFKTTQAVQQHMTDKGHCRMLDTGDAMLEYSDFFDYRSSYPDYDPNKEEVKGDKEEGEEEEEEELEDGPLRGEGYELVLPSGAVIGHRSLQRYYRQHLRSRQLVPKDPNAIHRAMAEYRALGWTGTTGADARKRAKDIAHFRRVEAKQRVKIGQKANKFQPHFRAQIFGC